MTATPLSQHTQIQKAVHSFLLESMKTDWNMAGRCTEVKKKKKKEGGFTVKIFKGERLHNHEYKFHSLLLQLEIDFELLELRIGLFHRQLS